jgi:rod shape-determining protein MreD
VRLLWVTGAILLALAFQTTLARFAVRGAVAIDLVLVTVVYVALTTGPAAGLLAGAAAGLLQDALVASPVIGIGGLAKTIVGFVAGLIGTQFIVTQSLPRFVVFFAATVVHAVVFMGLNVLLDVRHFSIPYATIAAQGAGNAVVGVVAFRMIELLPGAVERRRTARYRLKRP